MRWALVLLALLGSRPAGAVSLLVEATGARSFTAISLMGELELVKDRTFLTGCFGSMRSAPLEISSGLDGDPATVSIPRSNQLCLGLDQGFDDHWRMSVAASLSPKVATQIQVLTFPISLLYRSENASAGATLGLSYESAGLEDVQWAVDVGVAANRYNLSHEWIFPRQTRRFPASLGSLRPSVGVIWSLWGTELQLRGSYTFYSQDPLQAGSPSIEELRPDDPDGTLQVDQQRFEALRELFAAALQQASTRLMAADAVSGMASAPIQFELRPSVQHRFARWLRGQVGYTYDRYVPGAGYSHVASTKWTVIFSENVQSWVAASAQLDVPGSVPSQLSGILTLGVEVSF